MLQCGHHAGCDNVRVVSHVLGLVDHARRDTGIQEKGDPFIRGPLEQPFLNALPPHFDEPAAVRLRGVEARRVRRVIDTEDAPNRIPVLHGQRTEHERAALCVIAAVKQPVTGEPRRLGLADRRNFVVRRPRVLPRVDFLHERVTKHGVVHRFAHDFVGEQFQCALEQRNVDFLASS